MSHRIANRRGYVFHESMNGSGWGVWWSSLTYPYFSGPSNPPVSIYDLDLLPWREGRGANKSVGGSLNFTTLLWRGITKFEALCEGGSQNQSSRSQGASRLRLSCKTKVKAKGSMWFESFGSLRSGGKNSFTEWHRLQWIVTAKGPFDPR